MRRRSSGRSGWASERGGRARARPRRRPGARPGGRPRAGLGARPGGRGRGRGGRPRRPLHRPAPGPGPLRAAYGPGGAGPGGRHRGRARRPLRAGRHGRGARRESRAGPPPCIYAGRCGGCDFQHLTLAHQRDLKTAVVREQFARLAHLDVDVVVEPLPGSTDGLGWRTRVEYAVDADGRPGLHPHRSHAVLPIDRCLLASPGVARTDALHRLWPNRSAVDVVAPAVGSAVTIAVPSEMPGPVVTERVAARWGPEPHSFGHDFRVGARGFWQVHPAAASTLVAAVLAGLGPRPGGAGAGPVCRGGRLRGGAGRPGRPDGTGDRRRVRCRRRGVRTREPRRLAVGADGPGPGGRRVRGRRQAATGCGLAAGPRPGWRVGRWLDRWPGTADAGVGRPGGAGSAADGRRAGVAAAVAALGPRAAAYVAGDPAALARDTAFLHEQGYRLAALTAYDAFPMTHHVECVAVFRPVEDG